MGNESKDQLKDAGRRKLLITLAASGGAATALQSLPNKWTTPVVDSVILPAHAETSEPFTPNRSFATGAVFPVDTDDSILDFFVRSAYALDPILNFFSVCIDIIDGKANITVAACHGEIIGLPSP